MREREPRDQFFCSQVHGHIRHLAHAHDREGLGWQRRSEGLGACGQSQGGAGERMVVLVKAMGERVL